MNVLKSQVFSECIRAWRAGNLPAAVRLLRELDIPDSEPAARMLRDRLSAMGNDTAPIIVSEPNPGSVVAIVSPVFNGARFIEDTLASVLTQRGDFVLRYHVQDGGSTDGTLQILEKWRNAVERGDFGPPGRVKFTWSSNPDNGMYDAIVRGFGCLEADLTSTSPQSIFMTWLNADDALGAHALRTVASYFGANPAACWVTGFGALMNELGAVGRTFHDPEIFRQRSIALGSHDGRTLPFIQQEGTFWRRSLWIKAGGLDSQRFRLAGDWDLWRRFAREVALVKLHAVLGIHRRREGQLSADSAAYYAELDNAPSLHIGPSVREVGYWCKFGADMQGWHTEEVGGESPESSCTRLPVALDPGRAHELSADTHSAAKPLAQGEEAALPSGRPWPRISVVTPSFNQGKYIAETIESVIKQGYPDVEHIIIDGGSSDETLEVLERYKPHLSYVLSEKDRGQSDALNKGFARATGDILCWLNSDDQFAPDALFQVAMAFDTSGSDLVSGICEVYQDGKLVHRHMSACDDGVLPLQDLLDLDNGWNSGQFFYQPEVFFTRELWERSGGHVREDCYYSMDYELWCRFAYAGARIHVTGAPLAQFRMHPEQKTSAPDKFKAELVIVRDRFAADRGIRLEKSSRPRANWDRQLRIAMVNDIGFRYGAGIAHQRIAAGLEMAGHDVQTFELTGYKVLSGALDERLLLAEVHAYRPDIVVFGNVHAANPESTHVVDQLSGQYASFWLTHDFWLFTGRCAYTGGCHKYLTGCDESCPTSEQYPRLEADRIAGAWLKKQDLLNSPHVPVVLANSAWSQQTVRGALAARQIANVTVERIQLGAPAKVFRPLPKDTARSSLGIDPMQFVIAFSVSALDDARKGGALLMEALAGLKAAQVTLLLMGHADELPHIPGVSVLPLGYVSDTPTLVHALSAADVYVGPSLEESFGQVFIEAAMAGTASIGFDQTGVVDSIKQGVTGLRVAPSVGSLLAAIQRLHDDRSYCQRLGRWAAIHARNCFSLESAFRSMFLVWRKIGLVDEFHLPHRVGFVRPTTLVDDGSGELANWIPGEGISAPEGPFPPDFPSAFRWCHGPVVRFKVRVQEKGRYALRVSYQCPLFEQLPIGIAVGDNSPRSIMLRGSGVGTFDMEFTVETGGWTTVNVRPERYREAGNGEKRRLSFMLVDAEVVNGPDA
jgi:glycosyltransferase involved in cell wall biosynthesis